MTNHKSPDEIIKLVARLFVNKRIIDRKDLDPISLKDFLTKKGYPIDESKALCLISEALKDIMDDVASPSTNCTQPKSIT